MSSIIEMRAITRTTGALYARAFFLKNPAATPLMAGETRNFAYKYSVGSNSPATAFEIAWYTNQADADARLNRLTDPKRLPSVQFVPETPNTTDVDPDELQDGIAVLTAPAANGYENPVGVIEMAQDTGDSIQPHIYLLSDALTISTDAFKDYTFRYWIGNPAITAFHLEWYANRLDANLMVRQLTNTERLPRPVFTPETPNTDAEPTQRQEGTLRLYRPESAMPYTSVVGLLCINQDETVTQTTDKSRKEVSSLQSPRRPHRPTWEVH